MNCKVGWGTWGEGWVCWGWWRIFWSWCQCKWLIFRWFWCGKFWIPLNFWFFRGESQDHWDIHSTWCRWFCIGLGIEAWVNWEFIVYWSFSWCWCTWQVRWYRFRTFWGTRWALPRCAVPPLIFSFRTWQRLRKGRQPVRTCVWDFPYRILRVPAFGFCTAWITI